MNARATDVAVKPASGNCGCGCCSECRCESRCCELECLVRPNFFCGQLLTDADLGAMVGWAQGRLALARYRHGWGVACGLDITCTPGAGAQACCSDPHTGPAVYVQPGYALDCCGNDLVVCEPMRVDLGMICQPADDPCGNAPPANLPPAVHPDGPCWERLTGGILAVDLKLRYHEDLAYGQRPMFHGNCREVSPCEYTRVLEKPCVHLEIDTDPAPCGADRASEAWLRDFTERRRDTSARLTDVVAKDGESVVRYLRKHPPYRFCFLEDLVCCTLDAGGRPRWGDELLRMRVLFWLYLDWLLHELECPCPSCRPDLGVPIGRVLLSRRASEDGTVGCKVLFIDTSVPHRRRLRRDDCWPMPRGAVSLAPYLGHPVEELVELRRLGVRVALDQRATEQEVWGRLQNQEPIVDADGMDEDWSASAVADPFGCRRIAAIWRQ